MGRAGLTGRTAIVTGGAGLLGREHVRALAGAGARVALLDRSAASLEAAQKTLGAELAGAELDFHRLDVADEPALRVARDAILARWGSIDVLVNNAARNPRPGGGRDPAWARIESLDLEEWLEDLRVGLTGAFLCARVFGAVMARQGGGAIVNVASDLALIAPDQRLYQRPDRRPEEQPVKPVSYSVVKSGLLGLTRYLATYWAEQGVRVNALSPGGVRQDQSEEFVARVSRLVPLGRMARPEEYRDALVFLCSDASSYMTGQNLVVDGGRSCW